MFTGYLRRINWKGDSPGKLAVRVIENPDPREPWQARAVAYHYTLGESGATRYSLTNGTPTFWVP